MTCFWHPDPALFYMDRGNLAWVTILGRVPGLMEFALFTEGIFNNSQGRFQGIWAQGLQYPEVGLAADVLVTTFEKNASKIFCPV